MNQKYLEVIDWNLWQFKNNCLQSSMNPVKIKARSNIKFMEKLAWKINVINGVYRKILIR